MARTVRVEVDRNEQDPFLFPEQVIWTPPGGRREIVTVDLVKRILPLGDYRLAHAPRVGVVERKKNLDELAHNLLNMKDEPRFRKAWTRFVTGCRYPILAVEGSLAQADKLLRPSESNVTPPDVLGAFWKLVLSVPRLTVLWLGPMTSTATRKAAGAQLVRLLLACSVQD